MTRTLATKIVAAAFRHAMAERYPTRSVEYLLAWMMIAWSARVLFPGEIMTGLTYGPLLALAPEWAWGVFGVVVGAGRLYALIRNGGWKQSPLMRLIGAFFGLNFWIVLAALFTAAVYSGANDFPFRFVYPVLMFFEAYSCYRCGQDYAALKARHASQSSEGAPAAGHV